jgi:hypothetical protein
MPENSELKRSLLKVCGVEGVLRGVAYVRMTDILFWAWPTYYQGSSGAGAKDEHTETA